jgi:hypothetical protein
MTHQSVTVDTWNAIERCRQEVTTQQEVDHNQARLDNITWRYHNSAKQKWLSHCGGGTCQAGKVCFLKGQGQVSTKTLNLLYDLLIYSSVYQRSVVTSGFLVTL